MPLKQARAQLCVSLDTHSTQKQAKKQALPIKIPQLEEKKQLKTRRDGGK